VDGVVREIGISLFRRVPGQLEHRQVTPRIQEERGTRREVVDGISRVRRGYPVDGFNYAMCDDLEVVNGRIGAGRIECISPPSSNFWA
jgi:hypothetical protein